MKKNVFILFITSALSVVLVGCSSVRLSSETTIIGQRLNNDLWQNYHVEQIKEKETPYTLFFKNKDDTYSIYIFGSPISFYDSTDELNLIDTSLISVKDHQYKKQGYVLQTAMGDVSSYFPRKISKTNFEVKADNVKLSFQMNVNTDTSHYKKGTYIDLLGIEHESVIYNVTENTFLEGIPTTSGIVTRVVFEAKPTDSNLVFYIEKQEGCEIAVHGNQYLTISEVNSNVPLAIIRSSFVSDSSGQIDFNTMLSVEERDNQWVLSFELDKTFIYGEDTVYPIEISPKFEVIRNNIPDSSIYETEASDTKYLSDYSVIGTHPYYGIGFQYSKFRTHYVFSTYKQNIKSASYNFISMAQNNDQSSIEALRIRNFWKSPTITMDSRPVPYKVENIIDVSALGVHSIDISDYIRDCIHDDTQNTDDYGLLFVNPVEESYVVMATYDNTFYQPYVRIDFYTAPWKIEPLRDINPNTQS